MKYLTPFTISFLNALDHYRAIDKNLGRRFYDEVEEAKAKVIRFPHLGKIANGYRYVLPKHFPYKFCYIENLNGELAAMVLFHFKQQGLFRP